MTTLDAKSLAADLVAGDRPAVALLRGLPGAGKTTFARALRRALADRGSVGGIVDRDPLREMLGGCDVAPPWLSPDEEAAIREGAHAMARALLERGRHVIVASLNLDPAHVQAWAEVSAGAGARLVPVPLPVPVAECIRRDAGRPRSAGAEAILGLAADHGIRGDGAIPLVDVDAAMARATIDAAMRRIEASRVYRLLDLDPDIEVAIEGGVPREHIARALGITPPGLRKRILRYRAGVTAELE